MKHQTEAFNWKRETFDWNFDLCEIWKLFPWAEGKLFWTLILFLSTKIYGMIFMQTRLGADLLLQFFAYAQAQNLDELAV